MIEKVNISQVMNQYQIVTDADHVYVEKGNSQGKIKKNDFFNLLPFKNYGIVEGSLDEIGSDLATIQMEMVLVFLVCFFALTIVSVGFN